MKTFDRKAQDVGNIVALEHVNVWVPDQGQTTLFYVAGLGGTRDPYLMVSTDNMWVNFGQEQFHLITNKPQVLRGHTGLVVPDLDHLVARLDESEPWDQQLSVDEQQRLTFARAFLHRPEWLILDDATGALDEAMEQRVYETLAARLPDTSVLSITNRPTVAKFHQRHWTIVASADGAAALQTG